MWSFKPTGIFSSLWGGGGCGGVAGVWGNEIPYVKLCILRFFGYKLWL